MSRMSFRNMLLLVLPAALALALPARAAMLADSTVADAWRLDNGLEVRTRNIPGASGVSVTLAFRAGWGYEPAGREGLSELLAELEFMSAAGSVPERTREEMTSLRPLGWESRPGSRLVRLTEIATHSQLPGVLQQMATRLRGVTVGDADVRRALVNVRRDAGARLFGTPADVLYWRASALARGQSDEQMLRHAGMPGLERLGATEASALLARWYHAGNASLALAGDLNGLDVRVLVRSLFSGLPGGPAMPDTVRMRIASRHHTAEWKGLKHPVGVVAVAAPALDDSLHPSFYVSMLLTGTGVQSYWGAATAPLGSRFQFSLYDEPELVRFYPPLGADGTDGADADHMLGMFAGGLESVGQQIVTASDMQRVRDSVRWLLGGPLPEAIRGRFRRQPAGLGTVSGNMAARALWMGDAFWTRYLARFDGPGGGPGQFHAWLADTEHRSTLVLTPPR